LICFFKEWFDANEPLEFVFGSYFFFYTDLLETIDYLIEPLSFDFLSMFLLLLFDFSLEYLGLSTLSASTFIFGSLSCCSFFLLLLSLLKRSGIFSLYFSFSKDLR